MLKQMGFILMLVSSMAMSAKECTIDDIKKDGGQVWEIPAVCQSLDLIWNKIGDEGAAEIAEALKKNDTLTYLNLYNNNIGAEGAKALATAMKENKNIKLTEIYLPANDISAAGAEALAAALRVNDSLKILKVFSFRTIDGRRDYFNDLPRVKSKALEIL